MIQMQSRSLFLRVGAILMLVGLLVSSFYWSSAASTSRNTTPNQKSAGAPTEMTTPSALAGLGGSPLLTVGRYSSLFTLPQAPPPITVTTYASDCTTSKTVFNRADADPNGKIICAVITGAPSYWRVIWSNADSVAVQDTPVGSGSSTFTLTAGSSLGDWRVILYEPFGGTVQAVASFTVLDTGSPVADVTVGKGPKSDAPAAGSQVIFAVQVKNYGPSSASNVQLTDSVPANTTFSSFMQLTGPSFTCTNPNAGDVPPAMTTCTIANLDRGDTATFLATYVIDSGTAVGTEISNTANVPHKPYDVIKPDVPDNNTSTAVVNVGNPACVVTCPANITKGNDPGQYGAVVTYLVTDNGHCGTLSSSPSSGTFFPVGTTLVTVGGESGDPCSFTVTINDTENPTITCPANITTTESSPGAGADVNYPPPSATDNGPNVTTSCDHASGSHFDTGETVVTCTATDAAGNSDTCTFHVLVTPSTACVLTCPADITVNNETDACGAHVTFSASGSDATCDPIAYTTASGPTSSGSFFPVGTTVVTARAATGQACRFNITVVDAQPPAITCPPDKSATAPSDSCAARVDVGTATATENCSGVTITGVRDDGDVLTTPYPVGTTLITWTATDRAGLSSSCTQKVTVRDTVPPVVKLVSDINLSVPADSCTVEVPEVIDLRTTTEGRYGTAFDNCAGPERLTVVQRPVAGELKGPGDYTITVTVYDGDPEDTVNPPNSTTKTTTLHVTDTTPPTISCPANITKDNDPGVCGAVVTYATPVGSDNCAGATTAQTAGLPSGSTFPVGTTTNTFEVTDAAGNKSSCSFTVTVNDTEPPAISCPANITKDNDPGVCSAVVTYATPVGSDNCAGATTAQTAGLPSGSTFPVGTTTNTFEVTDAAGNKSSCSFTVTVNDTEPPTIATNGQTPVLWPANHAYHTFNVTNFVTAVSDNCGGVSVSDVVIQKVTSDEAENGSGSGNTLNDIVIAADCKSVQLRAERENSADGRVYTITFKLVDTHGNVKTTTSQVHVPKNLGVPVVDSGPHYTVNSNCP